MALVLHSPAALRSVAESPPLEGGARDWALTGLALQGEAPSQLPHQPQHAAVALLAGVREPEGQLATRLADAPHQSETVTLGLSLGVLDPAHAALREALHRACREGPLPARVHAAHALCAVGDFHAPDLRALAPALQGSPLERRVLPALILAASPEAERPAAAEAIRAALPKAGGSAFEIGAALGLPPRIGAARLNPEAALARVQARLGAALSLPPPRGSRRRRGQKWIAQLLQGVEGPAAALLRALYTEHLVPDGDAVAAAAILHLQRHHPLPAALDRALSREDRRPSTLYSARLALREATCARLDRALGADPPSLHALALLTACDDAAPATLAAALRHLLATPSPGAAHRAIGRVLAFRAPDTLAQALRAPQTRSAALRFSPGAATTPVLAALLELPLSPDPSDQRAYGFALASMGDRATLPLLRALQDQTDAELGEARRLADDLWGPSAW